MEKIYVTTTLNFAHEIEVTNHFYESLDKRVREKLPSIETLFKKARVIENRPSTIHTLLKDYEKNTVYLYIEQFDLILVLEKDSILKTAYKASDSTWFMKWKSENSCKKQVNWKYYLMKKDLTEKGFINEENN